MPTPRPTKTPRASAVDIEKRMRALSDPAQARNLQRFFKTGPGDYAEGDLFLGVMVPQTRKLVREFRTRAHGETLKLLKSPFHEVRLLALLIWVEQFRKGDGVTRQRIHRDYLRNTGRINNWDLVDVSAHEILGRHAEHSAEARKKLDHLIRSPDLWERRMALLGAGHFIRLRDFRLILKYAKIVLKDDHDLIHKASGWMLREAGKRDPEVLRSFLKKHATHMPRTMLRYAIEKLSPAERKRWLQAP